MMLPDAFGVEQRNKMVRLPWIKGLLGVFDFRKFIEYHDANPIVRDIYGKEHNVIEEDIQVIFTKSQFKMWNHYSSWDDYKEKYKRFNCSAGVTNEEEERIKNATINYQMLQSLTDITDDEILEIAGKTIDKLNSMCSSVESIKGMFGVTPYNQNKSAFQECIHLYPSLMNDEYAKIYLRRIKDSVIKRAKAGKLDVHGKYTFILPDFYAACQHWFLGEDEPDGLLDDGEVFCWLFRRDTEVDCLRSPHLFLEHAIRKNVACVDVDKDEVDRERFTDREQRENERRRIATEKDIKMSRARLWFTTDAVYTSCKDMISRILQFDVDGDKSLVVADKTLINVAKRNIEKYDIVPLYYDMKKAKPVHLDNKSVYDGLNAAFVGGNIGIYSNNISKIWNSDTFVNGSDEDKKRAIELIKVLCMENNFVIDYAKTLYKPTDKKDRQIIDANDSFVNKLERMIPNPRINFRKLNIGPIDYTLMMHDPNMGVECSVTSNGRLIEEETNPVIVEYCKFDKRHYMSVDSTINLSNTNKSESYMRMQSKNAKMVNEVRAALSRFGYDDVEIVDILVKYLYGIRKSANKTILWLAYGDVIYRNLSDKLKPHTKEVQCVDCGEWIEVGVNYGHNDYRCGKCAKDREREMNRLRVQRHRNNKK